MICKNKKCHKEIPDQSNYCLYCGKPQSAQKKKTRRGNGKGSVYKRKDVKTTPWVATAPAKLQNGKMVQEIIGRYETEKEANAALDLYRISPTERLSATLEDIYKEWKITGMNGISKQMVYCYNAAYNKLFPLHKRKFRDIRTSDMQQIIDYYKMEHVVLDKNGSPVNNKDDTPKRRGALSYSSLNDITLLLGGLYDYAIQNDVVNKKYSDFLILPPNMPTKKEYFSDIEIKKIKDAIGKVEYADYIYVLLYTGYRIEEFLTRTKFHYKQTEDGNVLIGGNKTEAGKNKIVPIHPNIQSIIDDCLLLDGETLFCRKDTKKEMSTDYFRKHRYYPALEQIGIRKLSPHAARRTFATKCDEAELSKEDLQALMGHAGKDVDDRHYVTKTIKKLSKAIKKLA